MLKKFARWILRNELARMDILIVVAEDRADVNYLGKGEDYWRGWEQGLRDAKTIIGGVSAEES